MTNENNNEIQPLQIEKPLANPYKKRIPRLGHACKKAFVSSIKNILPANEFFSTTRK
jgi:hypothetical protein